MLYSIHIFFNLAFVALMLSSAAAMMVLPLYVQSQSDCRFSIITLSAANTEKIEMICPVEMDLVRSEPPSFQWQWQKITHDDKILEIITENLIEGTNINIISLCLVSTGSLIHNIFKRRAGLGRLPWFYIEFLPGL